MSELKLPTEMVSLPSKGLLYPKESPLSTGEIEMKYMSAKEEDILTNQNYIKDGTVIDRLLKALIVTPINFDELLVADKDAILIAARILGYGKDYEIEFYNPRSQSIEKGSIDLSELKEKPFNESLINEGINEFSFKFPHTDNTVTFKLLTQKDEKSIDSEVRGLKKINPSISPDATTKLKYIITSVNGKRDITDIRQFVDGGYLLAKDARALREYYSEIQPGIELVYYPEGVEEGIPFSIGLNFFWPDFGA
jgi:hypothetical protein